MIENFAFGTLFCDGHGQWEIWWHIFVVLLLFTMKLICSIKTRLRQNRCKEFGGIPDTLLLTPLLLISLICVVSSGQSKDTYPPSSSGFGRSHHMYSKQPNYYLTSPNYMPHFSAQDIIDLEAFTRQLSSKASSVANNYSKCPT